MWVGAAAGMCHVRTVHVQVLALLLSEHLPKELSVGCFCCDVEVMARSGVRLGPKVEIVGARLCRSKGWIHWADSYSDCHRECSAHQPDTISPLYRYQLISRYFDCLGIILSHRECGCCRDENI